MDDNQTTMIVCIGSPLLDIIAKTDEVFLKANNLEANSATVLTNKELFKKVLAKDNKITIGGSITNTVRVLQAILKRKHAVAYLGAIGHDQNGKMVEQSLKKEGVQCIFKECEDVPTGMCAVLVNGENRSLCTDLGASKLYSMEDLRDCRVKQSLNQAKYVYFSAFFLGVSCDCVMEIIKLEAKTIAFNIGAAFLCKKYPKEILEILKHVDIVFGNDCEALALSELMNLNSKDIKTICTGIRTFLNRENQERFVVITRGADSLFVASKDSVKEYVVGNVNPEEIVDTNGAGDAFAGGFLAKVIQGYTVEEAVKCGIIAAGEVIKNVGCCFDPDNLYKLCK